MKKKERLKENRNAMMLRSLEIKVGTSTSPSSNNGNPSSQRIISTYRAPNPNGGFMGGADEMVWTEAAGGGWIGKTGWCDQLYDCENTCMEFDDIT